MTHVRLRKAAVVLTAVVFVGGLSGCWNPFAPKKGGGGGDTEFEYKERTSPENVIYNLTGAYENKSAEKYLECLAEDFIFFLNEDDIAVNPELPQYWGKAQERAIHENMFADTTDVQSVELTLTQFGQPNPVQNPIPGEPDLWEYYQNVDLWVHLPDELTYWANAGGTFLFDRDPTETGPNGEELWEIVEWQDVDKFTGKLIASGEGETPVSFTGLKAMYLR